jgi:hypothetical protein
MARHTKAEIEAILKDEFRKHREVYLKAKLDFEIANNGLGDPPLPDGALRLGDVGAAHIAALKLYIASLHELSHFIAEGEIPARFEI